MGEIPSFKCISEQKGGRRGGEGKEEWWGEKNKNPCLCYLPKLAL